MRTIDTFYASSPGVSVSVLTTQLPLSVARWISVSEMSWYHSLSYHLWPFSDISISSHLLSITSPCSWTYERYNDRSSCDRVKYSASNSTGAWTDWGSFFMSAHTVYPPGGARKKERPA